MRGLQMADDFGASTVDNPGASTASMHPSLLRIKQCTQQVGDLDLDFLKPSPHYAAWSKAADKAKAAAAATKPGVFTAHEAMQLDDFGQAVRV